MKCQTIIDQNHEEEVFIYAHRKTKRIEEIERFVLSEEPELLGYSGSDIVKLTLSEIDCFTIRDSKVFAMTQHESYQMKKPLYQLEKLADERFLKINQSCLANMKKIKKFDVSLSGALVVIFENGYRDYVSRRRLKAVKERMGIL